MPAIPQYLLMNFQSLVRAAKADDIALLDCTDAKTGAVVVALCAVNRRRDGEIDIVPIARMIDGNPYEELVPPSLEDVST